LVKPANAKFCQECGTSFGSAVEPKKSVSDGPTGIRVTAGQPAGEILDGERKTVTALFADIKGSMELIEDLDPEEARAIVDPVLQLMKAAVQSTLELPLIIGVRGSRCGLGQGAIPREFRSIGSRLEPGALPYRGLHREGRQILRMHF
jgi:hypothetical protein